MPVILYLPGGWRPFGEPGPLNRLVRELAVGVGAAVILPEDDRSPGMPACPVERSDDVVRWVSDESATQGFDAARFAVAGDSVAANAVLAVTRMAKRRGGPPPAGHVLLYPENDAGAGFPSSRQLAGLPPALVITRAAAGVHDEDGAYAHKLRAAGVEVTAVATRAAGDEKVQDALLTALRETRAAEVAVREAVAFLGRVLTTCRPAHTERPRPLTTGGAPKRRRRAVASTRQGGVKLRA